MKGKKKIPMVHSEDSLVGRIRRSWNNEGLDGFSCFKWENRKPELVHRAGFGTKGGALTVEGGGGCTVKRA